MKIIQTQSCRLLAVDVPEGSMSHYLPLALKEVLWYMLNGEHEQIAIPPGNWQILGKSESITEEQAKEIVESVWNDPINQDEGPYMDYTDGGLTYRYSFDTTLNSFHSLLSSHNIVGNKLILIEKI